MSTLNVLLLFAIVFFGLVWHDASSGSPSKQPTKHANHGKGRQNVRKR